MEEVAYGAINYMFCEANLEDFFQHYYQCFSIDVLTDAMMVSAHHQIRPDIKDLVFEIILDDITPATIVQSADGIFNFNQEIGLPSAQIRRWLQQDAEYGYAAYAEGLLEEISPPASRTNLLDRLQHCSHQDFCKIIRFLRIHDEITDNLDFPTTKILVDRFGCELKDDRLFYSILATSVMHMIAANEYIESED